MAREYQLFKTFTEVQRHIETKALQPCVSSQLRSTTFQSPFDGCGAN